MASRLDVFTAATMSPPHPRGPRQFLRSRRALLVALGISAVLHLLWSLWPAEMATPPQEAALTAELREMPAPPPPSAQVTPKPHTKPKPRRAAPSAPPVPSEPDATVESPDASTSAGPSPSDVAPAPPPSPEEIAAASAPAPEPPIDQPVTPTLPPRLDLAYKVYLGTHGFLIGDATYRFEHAGGAYHIQTVGQARGLAALILRGQGKLESRGLVTPTGLQPLEFAVERGSADRREVAHFDWEAGVVNLHGDETAALDMPTFDPLSVMWQPYFSPPGEAEQSVTLATTRSVTRYTFTREAVESIEWPQGEIETERWHRKSPDGLTDAYLWLAPSLHYVPVKMRVSRTMRGTLEVVLDSIRIDEPAAAQ